MNREIKFRGWSAAVKKMTYFGDGRGLITSSELKDGEAWGVFYQAQGDGCVYLSGYQAFMQSTGLTDKNGKVIFEGDILRATGDGVMSSRGTSIFEVRWDTKNACFIFARDGNEVCKDFGIVYHMATNMIFGICEVIGNIWENPELLKVSS